MFWPLPEKNTVEIWALARIGTAVVCPWSCERLVTTPRTRASWGTPLVSNAPLEVRSSACAWGDDGKTLYITAVTSVYKIRVNVAGEKPVYN